MAKAYAITIISRLNRNQEKNFLAKKPKRMIDNPQFVQTTTSRSRREYEEVKIICKMMRTSTAIRKYWITETILGTEWTGEFLLISIFLLINRRIMYCPKVYMTTKMENVVIFHTGVIPPVKTDILIREVSIIEAAITIDSIPTIQAFDSRKRKLISFNSF